jgi:uncharacterized metal-binding protein YceD (DUF177 family)
LKISLEDLRGLPQQRLKIDFKESLPELQAVKPVIGDLSMAASISGVRLNGRLRTILKLTCHTCLKPFFKALDFELDERFVYEDYLNDDPRDVKEKELQTYDFVESIRYEAILDISDIVYQAVTLATPIYCSCGEECTGPPSYDKQNSESQEPKARSSAVSERTDSIDPRWKNLKTLFPSEESR